MQISRRFPVVLYTLYITLRYAKVENRHDCVEVLKYTITKSLLILGSNNHKTALCMLHRCWRMLQ